MLGDDHIIDYQNILSKYSLQMTESPSRLNSHQKMVLGDDHIIDYQNMVSG